MNNETLIELQNRIYNQNKELGWHDEPRSFNTFVCLFHSELSEAVEGLRKGLMDDHLPQYPMFQVELADFVIRCFDYLGSINLTASDWDEPYTVDYPDCEITLLANLHGYVSCAFFGALQNESFDVKCQLMDAVNVSFNYSRGRFDLLQIINEKIEYNKHRADHKRSERAKKHGKKF